jgi:hypothetical protein
LGYSVKNTKSQITSSKKIPKPNSGNLINPELQNLNSKKRKLKSQISSSDTGILRLGFVIGACDFGLSYLELAPGFSYLELAIWAL